MLKRAFVLACLTFFLSVIPISAAPTSEASSEFWEDVKAENEESAGSNLGKFNTQNVNRIAASLSIGLAGGESLGLADYDDYYGRGVIPTTITYTANLYNRPVKTSVYVADVLKNANLIPQAYAQGIGFAGLNPVLNIWKAFRNIAYFAFIVIFVIIGFMIMLRKKISNNAVITIQEALPKIIVTLILITFSYAIAGLVIDLMYFSILLITSVFEQNRILTDADAANTTLFGRNIIGIGIKYFTGTSEVAGQAAEAMGTLMDLVLWSWAAGFASIIFYLIFVVAILIALFRTFIQLIMAYLGIILATIFAPIQLLPNAFPGSDAFGKWIKGLIANAAVFPVAATMVILGAALSTTTGGAAGMGIPIDTSDTNGMNFNRDGFIPPLIGNSNEDPGQGTVSAIQMLIGFGMIMLLPEVVKMTKEALQVKEPAFGDAAWKNAMAGKAVYSAPGKAIGGALNLGMNAFNYGKYGIQAYDLFNEIKGAPKGQKYDAIKKHLRESNYIPMSAKSDTTGVLKPDTAAAPPGNIEKI
jgi:hypothetical protein